MERERVMQLNGMTGGDVRKTNVFVSMYKEPRPRKLVNILCHISLAIDQLFK